MPAKNQPPHRFPPRFCSRLLLPAALPALALILAAAPEKKQTAPDPAGDAAPKLISTTGGDKRWPGLDALKKAAEANDPQACFELGRMQLTGAGGVEKNITRGLLHLETAAARGHASAAFRLGKIYADGELTPQNFADSFKYYRLAAAAGVSEARHNLGAAYASGRGVKRDYAEGLAWLILAAKTNPAAAAGEQQLREFLTRGKRPDLIAAGEKRARSLAEQLAREAEEKKPDAAAPAKPGTPAPVVIPPPKLEINPVAPPAITITPASP